MTNRDVRTGDIDKRINKRDATTNDNQYAYGMGASTRLAVWELAGEDRVEPFLVPFCVLQPFFVSVKSKNFKNVPYRY